MIGWLNRFTVLFALHDRYWVFGIVVGFLEEIPAYGLVFNFGAGGIVVGYIVERKP